MNESTKRIISFKNHLFSFYQVLPVDGFHQITFNDFSSVAFGLYRVDGVEVSLINSLELALYFFFLFSPLFLFLRVCQSQTLTKNLS